MANERKQWEANAYRTSNQQLYAILSQCYSFYQAMGESSDEAKALRADLKILANSLKLNGSVQLAGGRLRRRRGFAQRHPLGEGGGDGVHRDPEPPVPAGGCGR